MKILSPTTRFQYTEHDLISFILSEAAAQKHPVALWRLPGSSLTQLLMSHEVTEIDNDEFLEELDPGFLFAPFSRSAKRIFLKADRLFLFEEGKLQDPDTTEHRESLQWLTDQRVRNGRPPYKAPRVSHPLPAAQDRKSFIDMVSEGIREIEKGTFEKIVPSRTMSIDLPPAFNVIDAFQKLCAAYPEALISYVSIPDKGNWLGASPEVLVSVFGKRIFKTVALAGTLPYQSGTDTRSVAWTQKEIEEQALVGRYIISCFKKVRLREYDEHGPRTAVAGNLMHLKSEYTVDIQATNFPQIGTVMLDLLHPTSAVCGMPLEPALEFLRTQEPYDRRFYAGYLGPVNIHRNIELFVNIRCMELSEDQGILYAGAGVTVDSIPEREWSETEMKFNTLLNVIS